MNNYRPGSGRMSMMAGSILLAVCLMFCEAPAAADSHQDLYQENLQFDSKGNLKMTTHDKKATGGVRYRTIGWTIKRWPGKVSAVQCARVRLAQAGHLMLTLLTLRMYTPGLCVISRISLRASAKHLQIGRSSYIKQAAWSIWMRS